VREILPLITIDRARVRTTNKFREGRTIIYREFLFRWIRPWWGKFNLTDVRTIAVESWLEELRRRDGKDLANSTKSKIRNVMSVLFNHAICYEWLERNPITLVRQTAQRRSIPPVLEPDEVQNLLAQLENPFRVMVLLDVTTGLKKRIGWHTFSRTYSSTLIANGENVKVVQELMRHASSRFTLEVYTQAKVGS
jgi:site-specific recombinase XerD